MGCVGCLGYSGCMGYWGYWGCGREARWYAAVVVAADGALNYDDLQVTSWTSSNKYMVEKWSTATVLIHEECVKMCMQTIDLGGQQKGNSNCNEYKLHGVSVW